MSDNTPSRGLSRRDLLRRAGISAGALAGASALSAATAVPAAAAATVTSATSSGSAAEGVLQLARVWFTKEQQEIVAQFDDTHNVFSDGSVEILLWPGNLEKLQASGLRFEITVPDLIARDTALAQADSGVSLVEPQPGEKTDYRHLADYNADMAKLAETYPTMARLLELPHKTLEGRTVYGLEIAKDVHKRDGRAVFYNDGCHHAREWPAAEVPMMWAYDLLENYGKDPRITNIVDNTRNIVVPVVNVDGFEYSRKHPMTAAENGTTNTAINLPMGLLTKGSYWRKNKRSFIGTHVGAGAGRLEAVNREKGTDVDAYGVDPNRNYAYAWGDNLQGSASWKPSDTYRGEKPNSEAEVQNVSYLLRTNQATAVISHHTSGNLVLWAWGDTTDDAVDNDLMEGLGRAMATHNGYTPQKSIQLYVTTGTCSDYAYGVFGSIGYTFEHAGSTFHPPYATTVPAMYAKNRPSLIMLAEEMCLPPELRPAGRELPEVLGDFNYNPSGLNHSIIRGQLVDAAGNGVAGTVTLRKRFETLLWKDGNSTNPAKQRSLEEIIETTMETQPDGTFVYHVNPSTRPFLQFEGLTESYELAAKGGGRGSVRDVVAERGKVVDLGKLTLS
jgi:hypothetical protein